MSHSFSQWLHQFAFPPTMHQVRFSECPRPHECAVLITAILTCARCCLRVQVCCWCGHEPHGLWGRVASMEALGVSQGFDGQRGVPSAGSSLVVFSLRNAMKTVQWPKRQIIRTALKGTWSSGYFECPGGFLVLCLISWSPVKVAQCLYR